MANPEGESVNKPLRLAFDRRLKLEFHGSRITSDAGLLAYRELDDALGLTGMIGDKLVEMRTGKNSQHAMTGLFRQSVFGRLGGYEDVNDADRLGRDPAMRWIVGGRAVARAAASTSQMGASRPNFWPPTGTSPHWRISPGDGSTACTSGVRPRRSCSISTAASARPMAIRKAQPTTVTSAAPAITRFSFSISSATWSGAPCGPATCIAPTAGATCWSRLSPGIGIGSCGATSEGMPPSPHRTSMSSWKPKATPTPSVSRPTRFFKPASLTCSRVPSVARPTMFAASMPASAIGQARGTGSAGSSPRWSGTQGSCIPGSASSSPIWPGPPNAWWPFTTSGARRSSTSRRARTPSGGRGLSCQKFRNNEVRLQLHALAYNLGNFMRTLACRRRWSTGR